MAKTYYSIDEAKEKLGADEDALKALVRDGKLREFRDAGKVHYRIDEIEKLAAASPAPTPGESSLPGLELAGDGGGDDDGDELLLEPVEDEPPKAEVKPKTEEKPKAAGLSGSSLPLADDEVDAGSSDSGLIALDDSEVAPADEVTLDDSTTAPSGNRKDDTVITSAGISVFDDEDLEAEADPMAKTVLTASASDQVALEGIGSGSGLLDLSREADDTSLGAELLDEIYPGQEETRVEGDPEEVEGGGAAAAVGEPEAAAVSVVRPMEIVDDPYAPAFTAAMVVAALMLSLSGAVAAAFVRGVWPGYLQMIYSNFWASFGGSFGLFVVVFGAAYFVCRSKVAKASRR